MGARRIGRRRKKGGAFKAAIDHINPALCKIMEDAQSILQSLMHNLSNTSAVAYIVVNWVTADFD